MREAHALLHAKQSVPSIGLSLGTGPTLLAVDEFQMTDIADAAILSRLTSGIISSGCLLLATSNRAPLDLYQGGLNRHVYIPAFARALDEAACG